MFKFSSSEIRDLIIAFFVISIAFSILYSGTNFDTVIGLLPMIMVGVGLGFIFHEIAHKLVAMHYGYWAEFKNWIPGLIIALVSPIFGFIFAAPGAVHIYGNYMTDKENGIISLSGPTTNIVLGLIFMGLAIVTTIAEQSGAISDIFVYQILLTTFTLGFAINGWLALFNLIPIGVLDGAKIVRWNPFIWLVVAIIAGLMVYYSMFGF
ncbi:MAG: site-2 protease family protein [Methanobrevibacter sp.]|jgi:Zn-dependent protease|nr:site-2 protease family protein [Methanobrevibacter sp.]